MIERLRGLRSRLSLTRRRPTLYRIGMQSIELPVGHLLPQYQRAHPAYDRFLPLLAQQLEPGSVVVDVGANVGDTLAALVTGQAALEVVCIEPDAGFYALLLRNIDRLRSEAPALRVHSVRSLAGARTKALALVGEHGTRQAFAVDGAGDHALTLDALLAQLPGNVAARVRLLKCDVDGWDFDVIDSGADMLARAAPILYFECQIKSEEQRTGYLHTIDRLFRQGYQHWWAFDNFGGLMQRCSLPEALFQLMDYVWRQERGMATRSVHYLDLLACRQADAEVAEAAVRQFTR